MTDDRDRKLKITETVLRDAQQSLIATRMTTEDMEPILEKLDGVGYHSIECWGGATFDACLRFLNEDPWQRLRILRKKLRSSRLQMLLRGQNLLGYRNYADDTVEYFVKKSISEGIDIIRVFDALNDLRNLKVCVKAAKAEGGEVQMAAAYIDGGRLYPRLLDKTYDRNGEHGSRFRLYKGHGRDTDALCRRGADTGC